MHLLIISRPGISLYAQIQESETAWHAIRFYDPEDVGIGIFLHLTCLSAALTLASDLRYFIRKYAGAHLFRIGAHRYCTPAFAKKRYLVRDQPVEESWPYTMLYTIDPNCNIYRIPFDENYEIDINHRRCICFLEVWGLKEEYLT